MEEWQKEKLNTNLPFVRVKIQARNGIDDMKAQGVIFRTEVKD